MLHFRSGEEICLQVSFVNASPFCAWQLHFNLWQLPSAKTSAPPLGRRAVGDGVGKLGSGPALDGAGGAGAFGVEGDEPDLIQSSADPRDGDRDLDGGLTGSTGGELFDHASWSGDARVDSI